MTTSEPRPPATLGRRLLTGLWQWPLPISMLALIVFGPTSGPVRTAFVCDMAITGAGTVLTGLLLRFVALPRLRGDAEKDRTRTIAYYESIAMPTTAIGALILGLAAAFRVLPDRPVVNDIAAAVFFIPLLGVLGLIMVRAWRIFTVRPAGPTTAPR